MKNVTFGLGPANGLTARQLTVTRMRRAGDDASVVPTYDADVGAVIFASVSLVDNVIYQAVLVDTATAGEVSDPDVLNFHTGNLQFPGPRTGDRLSILTMEDESSSSSSLTSSQSSTSTSSSSLSSESSSSSSTSSLSSSSSSSSTSESSWSSTSESSTSYSSSSSTSESSSSSSSSSTSSLSSSSQSSSSSSSSSSSLTS